MSFKILNEEEEKEIYRLQKFYWKEALRCENAELYLSGCVMIGSALEAILISMVNCYHEEAEATHKIPKTSKGKVKPLLDWTLAELLKVAKAAKWLPSGLELEDGWNYKKAKIGDYAEVVRMVRNLLHPAKYLKEHSRGKITKKYLERQFEIALGCRDWLAYHNNKSLLRHLEEEKEVRN